MDQGFLAFLDDCVMEVINEGQGSRMILLAPFITAKASVLREEFESLERRGYQRVRIDNEVKRLDDYDYCQRGRS